jgi:ABC-type sugar transport system ATPase subunit
MAQHRLAADGTPPPDASPDVVLRVDGLAKAFGATQALRSCTLELRRGEVLALMGENGSGKSTLVKILSGVHRPDRGTIEVAGERLPFIASPRAAVDAGIATVFQEILVAAQQSVLANIWLGRDGLVRRSVLGAQRRERAAGALGQLIDNPRLNAAAGRLPLSDRQATCIARALLCEPRVLILDEATSTLDVATRDRLFAVLRGLCAEGVGVLFISHRMDEVEEIADRVTVMRSGDTVATRARGEASARELVQLMTGIEDAGAELQPAQPPSERVRRDEVVLRASKVRLHAHARPIDAEFRAGELVGVAGLEGHGQDRFLRVLAGAPPTDGAVICARGGDERALRSPGDALARRIAYIPRDRRGESIFESRSIVDNFNLTTVRDDRRAGLVRRRLAEQRFERYVGALKIRAGLRTNRITSLSGGNQQKVVVARWLATNPRALLLNDPTRGVDAGTKSDIYQALNEAAASGVAVVMLSTEVIELVELMDRVLVFREGDLFRELSGDRLTREQLVASYFGREDV